MYGTRFKRRGALRPEITPGGRSRRRLLMRPAAYAVLAAVVCLAAATLPSQGKSDQAKAAAGPVGNGFTVTPADLAFILKQIKIAERHRRAFMGTPDPGTPVNPDPTGDPDYCQSLVGPNANQIPDRLTAYGLRTVDGSCNNLFPNREKFAAADQPFPRLTTPVFSDAEASPTDFFGPGSGTIPGSSYAQKRGFVFDTQPRLISNLIVDQTSTNPAAVAAAQFPVRTQQNPGVFVCGNPGAPLPPDCVPEHKTLFIPNVTTDVGLSPPYNSLFTFFGQFFDHGVDQTVKSGGTVFVPLRADDPLHHARPRRHRRYRRRGSAAERLHGADACPEPAWSRRYPRRRPLDAGRRVGGRHPEREQHRLAVGRPEPDVYLALLAPGLPARVRGQRGRPSGLDRQAAGRPSGRPDLPQLARRPGRASAPGRQSRSRPPRSSVCCWSTRT